MINIVGVIPARGGSKGIPRKNIKPLLGRPLIAYTIIPALQSRLLADVVVSSEDEEILSTAASYGAKVIRRPQELASDEASTIPVVLHALDAMENDGGVKYDAVMLLQPTTPLRRTGDIDGALQKLITTGADSIISVVQSPGINPEWMKYIVDDTLIDYDVSFSEMGPRQNFGKLYIRNGAIYAARTQGVRKYQSFKGGICRPYMMPESEWVNIDTPRDWALAEALMKDRDWSWIKPVG